MRSRVAYRKRRQNRFSMFLVSLIVVLIMVIVMIKSMELRSKIESYADREEQLRDLIAEEEQRAQEIEEYGKYTQTKGFVEEVAKDKLGLMYEGEILFKEE